MKSNLREAIEKWKIDNSFGIRDVKEDVLEEGNYALKISCKIDLRFNSNATSLEALKGFQTFFQGENTGFKSLRGDLSIGDLYIFEKLCLEVEEEIHKKARDWFSKFLD